MLPSRFSSFRLQTSVHSPLFSVMWVSFIKSHKNMSFGSRSVFYIEVVSNITSMKYEILWCFLHILDAGGISSGDSGCTIEESQTRHHGLGCLYQGETGPCERLQNRYPLFMLLTFLFFNITKSCLRNFNFQI